MSVREEYNRKKGQSPSLIFSKYDSDGIKIEYIKSTKMFYIYGWFDHCVGIEGGSLSLQDFIDGLQLPVTIKGKQNG